MTNIEKYLAKYTNEKDSGRIGKAFELATREYLSGREQTAVRAQGKVDAYFSFKTESGRKSVTVEIKTACGCIDTADKSQYIIYCPEVDETTAAEAQGFVFSRDEWKDFVEGYEGRGAFLKVDSQRGTKHIQSFRSANRPKASKPIAEYIWDKCYDQPTVEEWKEMMRGE